MQVHHPTARRKPSPRPWPLLSASAGQSAAQRDSAWRPWTAWPRGPTQPQSVPQVSANRLPRCPRRRLQFGPIRQSPSSPLESSLTGLESSLPMDSFTSSSPSQIQTSASVLEAADIFESSLTLETTHYDDGYTDGYKVGIASGKQDGYEVGVRHGFQLGEELGFYKGLVDVWLRALGLDPSCFSSRVQKSVQQMSELLEQYPVQEPDPESESVDETKANLRLKFRAVCASMGVKLEYNGYPKMSDSMETEF